MTTADAIRLYRAEKAAYLARTRKERAAMMERVRVQLAADGGMKAITVSDKGAKIAADRFAAARARGQKASKANKPQSDAYYHRHKRPV